jgi:hypothetical protein
MCHKQKIGTCPIKGFYIDPLSKEELEAIEYIKKHGRIKISKERLMDAFYISYALETGKLHPDIEKETQK